MPNFLVQDWDYLTSELESLWNPEAVGGAGGSTADVLYNAATGQLTDAQIKSKCQQFYDAQINAGGTKQQAQAAYDLCAKAAQQPGGTDLIAWAVLAVATVLLIKSL